MAKKAISITVFGILTILIFSFITLSGYYIYVLMPFFDERKNVKVKIRLADSDRKKRHYKKKYRQMKLEIVPLLGPIFKKVHETRMERKYRD